MKYETYKKYLREVLSLYRLNLEQLYSDTRERGVVDARQLLFLLLRRRPMRLSEICRFASEDGCSLNKSNVLRGIQAAERRMFEDRDVKQLIEDIELRNG